MKLDHITWHGPPIDDHQMLARLPNDLRELLSQANGFIQFNGGFHVRGASLSPAWHSLRTFWESDDAFHNHYQTIREDDIPFAQDALGDQFLLRDGHVVKLSCEIDAIDSLGITLNDFLKMIQKDPINLLALQPLENHRQMGGQLTPGQLLSVMPPFAIDTGDTSRTYRSIDAFDRLRFLSDFAMKIRSLPDGTPIVFEEM